MVRVSGRIRIAAIALALTAACGFLSPSSAATVELLVQDELDQAVAGTGIGLRKIEGTRSYFRFRKTTDPAGRVVLEGVEPGRYAVHVFGARKDFVSLPDHPSIPSASITVVSNEEQLRSVVRVVRGGPVVFRVSAGGQALPTAKVLLHDLDREYRTEIDMDEHVEREVRLVAGRWTARIEPVPGYLLTSVEVNRSVFPNHIAEFDLPTAVQAWYVNFEFAAQTRVGGKIIFEGGDFSVRVVSHLQEAGDWLAAAQARGGSQYEAVWARPNPPHWDYEMVVPEGRWIVRPEASGLTRSDPPEVELQLRAGDYERVDFVVAGANRGGGKWAHVRVTDPQRKPVSEAVVEAWPADPDARDETPVATERTHPWGAATLHGLGDEEYFFIAGKPGLVEASRTLKPPHPTKGDVRLQLGLGATIHAMAQDAEGTGVAGVDVVLTREDDFVSLLADPEISEWASRPAERTDGTGHLWMRGIYPGLYRLTGTRRESESAMYFAEFRDEGDTDWNREMKKEYRGTETDDIEIRLVPAGLLRGTVHCSDGSDLPPEADIVVLDANRRDDKDDNWEAATHRSEAFVLQGERRDGFHLGPLDEGAFHLLIRPQDHNRWTWALGTEAAQDATLLSVEAGDPTDIGTIAIDCAPAISIRPIAPDDVELPDLVITGLYEPLAELTAGKIVDGEPTKIEVGRLAPEPDRIQFRDLAAGPAEMTVTLRNPLFLPQPTLTVPINTTLERGKTYEVAPRLQGIGGAIDVILPDEPVFAAVVVTRVDDDTKPPIEPWILEVQGPSMLIPSLIPGTYEIAACPDPACEQRVDLWNAIDVRRGVIQEATRIESGD